MRRKKVVLSIIIILALAILTGVFNYPRYFNKGVDFVNSGLSLALPHFWQVPFKLGLDLQGGTHLVYKADLSDIDEKKEAMQGLRDVIERRVNIFGVQEPKVQTQDVQGNHRLIVELAGVLNVSEAIDMIGQTPFLEFKELLPEEERNKNIDELLGEEADGVDSEIICRNADLLTYFLTTYQGDPCFQPTGLTGQYLEKAEIATDQYTYQPMVSLQFNGDGSDLFQELTARNINKPLAIYIDGIPISIPNVNEAISGGKAQISGNFTVDSARALVRNLNAGALPFKIELIFQQTVGPTLGSISLQKSLRAGFVGLLAIILFMIIFYRMPGILASLALMVYISFILALFKIIPVTLTLAGIGGFLLSIGMAIDANILIFSRTKEELENGNSFAASVEEGFSRAWPAIRDGNITTLIIGLILFIFGTSFIKGFALTLSLGVLLSMVSAIFVTKSFLRVCVGTKIERYKWLWK